MDAAGTTNWIGVLGPVAVAQGGEPSSVSSGLQRLLVAVLVARAGQVVTADQLVEALWGERVAPPDGGSRLPLNPRAALQSQVFRLRSTLGPAGHWLETQAAGYRLHGGADRIDANRFEDLVAQARGLAAGPHAVLLRLDAALGLWRGSAYLDVPDCDLVRAEAERLEDLRAEAAELRADLLIDLGRWQEATGVALGLESAHPFRARPARDGAHGRPAPGWLSGPLERTGPGGVRVRAAGLLRHGRRAPVTARRRPDRPGFRRGESCAPQVLRRTFLPTASALTATWAPPWLLATVRVGERRTTAMMGGGSVGTGRGVVPS